MNFSILEKVGNYSTYLWGIRDVAVRADFHIFALDHDLADGFHLGLHPERGHINLDLIDVFAAPSSDFPISELINDRGHNYQNWSEVGGAFF